MPRKNGLGINVLQAAQERISWTFDTFSRIYVSFSAGKDSTCMLHLVMDEAIKRKRKVGVLLVDLEGQYQLTIEHGLKCFEIYRDHIEPYWVALPIRLRNAVSQFQSHWVCWDPEAKEQWIRQPPKLALTDQNFFPFFRFGMEFEEFVPAFGHWYAQDKLTACFVGIRTRESLNRWRTIAGHGRKFEGRNWTNWIGQTLYNVYPIYDWHEEDLWAYHGKTGKPHNELYNRMHQAGLTLSQMRICQPYGDDQRKGLWLFHIIEPETWSRVVARVSGANSGALYAQESGNILGRLRITKPAGHTWESFAKLLLNSMPAKTREHYENKIATFIHWYGGTEMFPDEADPELERSKKAGSWRRVCKVLLKHDYWCKEMCFGQQFGGPTAYERYKKIMDKRKRAWGIKL